MRDGDRLRVIVDTRRLDGRIDLVRQDPATGEDVPDDHELAGRLPGHLALGTGLAR